MNNSPGQLDQNNLLFTKLEIPYLGAQIIQRKRLLALLQSGMKKQITLITAPMGYGKTTLLSEWTSTSTTRNLHTCWVTLDETDNSPLHFWLYIVAALKQNDPKISINLKNITLTSDDLVLLHPLFNAISSISHRICLILDDYHVITNQQVHRSLSYLIEHQPRNLHLVISSRTPPPIHFSRLRAEQKLNEITSDDLSFTLSETELFLTSIIGLELNKQASISLHNLTKGWISGIQLVAVSMKNKGKIEPPVDQIRYGFQEIKEYFSEEILSHRDKETRSFLLRTSILTDLSAPLCDTLSESHHSQEILEKIAEEKLFITPKDDLGQWYSYHPLFAEILRVQLKQEEPELVTTLHLRACEWLINHGFAIKAIRHAMEAGDMIRAATIAENCALQALIDFDLASLLHWTSLFTNETLQQHPRLLLYSALAAFMIGDMDLVESKLEAVERLITREKTNKLVDTSQRSITWATDVIRSTIQLMHGDITNQIREKQNLIRNAPSDDTFITGFLYHSLAISFEMTGDLDAAAEAFETGSKYALDHHLSTNYVQSSYELISIHKRQGLLHLAEVELQNLLNFISRTSIDPGLTIPVKIGLIEISVERNDFTKYLDWIKDVIDNMDRIEMSLACVPFVERAFTQLAKYFLAIRDIEKADFFTRRALESSGYSGTVMTLHGIQTIFPHHNGFLLGKLVYTTKPRATFMELEPYNGASTIFEKTILIYDHLANHRPEKALKILSTVEATSKKTGDMEIVIEVLVLRAIAYQMANNTSTALSCISNALRIAEPEGYSYLFIEKGQIVKDLLLRFLSPRSDAEHDIDPLIIKYAEKLLDTFQLKPVSDVDLQIEPHEKTTIISGANKPLSKREQEVLALIADGKTTKEIALHLIVSINTVKAHTKSIFKKLSIHNRTDLLQFVRENGFVNHFSE